MKLSNVCVVHKLYLNKPEFRRRPIEHLLDAGFVNCEERINKEEIVENIQGKEPWGNEKEEDPEPRWRS